MTRTCFRIRLRRPRRTGFQLDYLCRKARGRLAEILGPDGVEFRCTAPPIGLGHIAHKDMEPLSLRKSKTCWLPTQQASTALIDDSADCLPIEFDLLGYRPEPWAATDSLAIMGWSSHADICW